jgi:hypothetical protein
MPRDYNQGMWNQLLPEAIAAFVREAREQAEEFRSRAEAARMMSLSIQSQTMERRCIKEHQTAMTRIDAEIHASWPATQE